MTLQLCPLGYTVMPNAKDTLASIALQLLPHPKVVSQEGAWISSSSPLTEIGQCEGQQRIDSGWSSILRTGSVEQRSARQPPTEQGGQRETRRGMTGRGFIETAPPLRWRGELQVELQAEGRFGGGTHLVRLDGTQGGHHLRGSQHGSHGVFRFDFG